MEIIADLHIHSRYSMATSKLGTPEYLDLWARKKGISLVGTGDFTHPAWREELKEKLVPAESGLYRLRDEYVMEEAKMLPGGAPRFVITGEISSIYKKNGKCRKVHNVLLLSGFEEADKIAGRLEKIGNIHSDGRRGPDVCPRVTRSRSPPSLWRICGTASGKLSKPCY